MILYKTGDACPCCGQPIKLRSKADRKRREVKMPEAWA